MAMWHCCNVVQQATGDHPGICLLISLPLPLPLSHLSTRRHVSSGRAARALPVRQLLLADP